MEVYGECRDIAGTGPSFASFRKTTLLVVSALHQRKSGLEHFLFYCKPLMGSLNQACALAGVMHGRASAMA